MVMVMVMCEDTAIPVTRTTERRRAIGAKTMLPGRLHLVTTPTNMALLEFPQQCWFLVRSPAQPSPAQPSPAAVPGNQGMQARPFPYTKHFRCGWGNFPFSSVTPRTHAEQQRGVPLGKRLKSEAELTIPEAKKGELSPAAVLTARSQKKKAKHRPPEWVTFRAFDEDLISRSIA